MKRLALVPPAVPSPWWSALLRSVASRPDLEVLWVSGQEPADRRVLWLPFDPAAGRPRPGGAARTPDGGAATAAVVLDARSPRAADVAAIGRQVPLVVVLETPLSTGPAAPGTVTVAALERLVQDSSAIAVVCTDAATARVVPASLQPLVRIVPLGVHRVPAGAPTAEPMSGAPTVALLGGVADDAVRLAWARVTQRWPDAVLVTDVDGLDLPSRSRVLQQAQVVVVLDSAGDRLAEALASGATVVAHGDAYAASVVDHAVHGLLTDARAPDLLAAVIVYAVEYHEQLAGVRAAGRERARTHLSADTLGARLLAAMERAGAPADATPARPAAAPVRADVPVG